MSRGIEVVSAVAGIGGLLTAAAGLHDATSMHFEALEQREQQVKIGIVPPAPSNGELLRAKKTTQDFEDEIKSMYRDINGDIMPKVRVSVMRGEDRLVLQFPDLTRQRQLQLIDAYQKVDQDKAFMDALGHIKIQIGLRDSGLLTLSRSGRTSLAILFGLIFGGLGAGIYFDGLLRNRRANVLATQQITS